MILGFDEVLIFKFT